MEGHDGPAHDDSGLRDNALVESYRSGNPEAAGTLFERHRKAALGYARHLAGPSNAEDVASEAFLKTLRAIEAGNGPTSNFRSYLLTTVHNTYVSLVRTDAQFVLQPDFDAATIEEPTEDEDASLRVIAEAFAGLPERWQIVLWYTLIERRSLEETASAMEITPQAAGSLRYRARNGLYEAVLTQLPNRDAECAAVRRLLRQDPDQLTRRNKRLINNHVPDCDQCDRAAKAAPFGVAPALAILAGTMLGGAYFLIGPPQIASATVAAAAAGGVGGVGGAGGAGGAGGVGGAGGAGGAAAGGPKTDGGLARSLALPAAVVLVLVLIITGVLLARSRPGGVAEEAPPPAPIAPPAPTNSSRPPPPASNPPASTTQPPTTSTVPPSTAPPPATSPAPPASPDAPATNPPTPPVESAAPPAPRDPRFQNVTVTNPAAGSYDVTFQPSDAAVSTTIDFEVAELEDVRINWGPDIPTMTCSAPVDGRFRCQVRAAVADGKVTVRLRTGAPLRGSMTMIDREQGDTDPTNNKITWG